MTLTFNQTHLPQNTASWKSQYSTMPDYADRNKTLSEIMFAVRTRMRDNESALRFGESSRPNDRQYGNLVMAKHSPRWKANEGLKAVYNPRRAKVRQASGGTALLLVMKRDSKIEA